MSDSKTTPDPNFPGAPIRRVDESEVDFTLRQAAYDDGRFGKSYGLTKDELHVDTTHASTDNTSLQGRVDAYRAGARDRREKREHIAKIVAAAGAFVVAVGYFVFRRHR